MRLKMKRRSQQRKCGKVKQELRTASWIYELRVQIHELRVQIHVLQVQIHQLED